MPFVLLAKVCAAAISRRRNKAPTITSPMINRIAMPEAISTGSSQLGVSRFVGGVEETGNGVVTTACSAGTSVPTAENWEEVFAVAICVPLVTANTPVN